MSQLTSKEKRAIEIYPLDDTFSQARDALCEAEEDSAEDDILEADNSNTEPGWTQRYSAAVGKVLYDLYDADTSYMLASRMGRTDIKSDLEFIHKRLEEGEFEHALFRSFSQRVTRQASEIDIWEAVIDLIQTIDTVAPPRSSTPIRCSSASFPF